MVVSGFVVCVFFFFQAEDGIRDAQESRGLGDVYKRQLLFPLAPGSGYTSFLHGGSQFVLQSPDPAEIPHHLTYEPTRPCRKLPSHSCLLYTSDAADEEDSVDLGGRRIIKKK